MSDEEHSEERESTMLGGVPPSLDALAAASRSGDDGAAALFIRRIWTIAFSVATRRFGLRREDAEEVAQDVCLAAIQQRDAVLRFEQWVFAVASHRSISTIRHRAANENALRSYAALEPQPIDRGARSRTDAALDLRRLLEGLPTATRSVLFLRFALDLSWADIDRQLFDGNEQSRHRARVALFQLARRLKPTRRPRRSRANVLRIGAKVPASILAFGVGSGMTELPVG